MRYQNLVDLLLPRAERLGLVDRATGVPDVAELELYVYQALLNFVDMFDFESYTEINTEIFVTEAAKNRYPLPETFGRMILPRVRGKRGIFLRDIPAGTDDDLEYLDTNTFARKTNVADMKPRQFTIARRELLLFPTPDTHGGANYTVHGVYIVRVDLPDLEDEVLLSNPSALIHEAISLLAGDMGRLTDAMTQRRTEAVQALLQSQTRNARLLQQVS